MANFYYDEEFAEKGRIVYSNHWVPSQEYQIHPEHLGRAVNWSSKTSIWGNRTKSEKLKEFAKLKDSEITERMGFLAWNEAAVNQANPTWKLVNL
ncbi:MAG: hypothetical protein VX879_05265, partial [Pseudomonadota bacterium]|nr:hypothetical protein [Pseudomonadota bacterium]